MVRQRLSEAERHEFFDREVRPFMGELYGTALRYTRDAEDAEDLLQEACMKAFTALHQFEPGTNLRAWLHRILRNTFTNLVRKRSRRPQESLQEDITDDGRASHNDDSVEYQVLNSGLPEEMKQALADLGKPFRTAVYLADIEGYAYKEIAEMMGTPVGTVMSRLHRGRKSLQDALTPVQSDIRAIYSYRRERAEANPLAHASSQVASDSRAA